jgi:bifunctional DNA-binding transcriptional regulator/antitoxin component of YhaV-PrlF toxin-antitoxin module
MKKENKNVRKLTKTGRGSMYVVLPKEFLADLGWKERQKLTVQKVKRGILIKDWKRR